MTRRKKSTPSMLFWNRRDQTRFIDAVERLASLVNDMEASAKRPNLKTARKGTVEKVVEEIEANAVWLRWHAQALEKEVDLMEKWIRKQKLWDAWGAYRRDIFEQEHAAKGGAS